MVQNIFKLSFASSRLSTYQEAGGSIPDSSSVQSKCPLVRYCSKRLVHWCVCMWIYGWHCVEEPLAISVWMFVCECWLWLWSKRLQRRYINTVHLPLKLHELIHLYHKEIKVCDLRGKPQDIITDCVVLCLFFNACFGFPK